jgi:ketosteroid isomerase-like protein
MHQSEIAALIAEYYDRIDLGDREGAMALFHPDVIYYRGGAEPIVGHRELVAFYESRRAIISGRHTLDRIVIDGVIVAVQGSFRGVLKDGDEVCVRFADFHHLRDGKIWRRHSYFMERFI